ncbi:trafficking protein particle complex subunit 10 [Tricharina praecox]|uniref:trafficking protein particle complex subunit 10 n=1 Tax=Tricharina praecox TaxID=43433 RepID=UPI0022210AA7|nr:trafficking protein particle complex subunit 10 [Tricharina praecox]XP_051339596.1 trafficking protein particle complex subunit 10 [Tricharina praecox]KAI5841240.1 trafficking protein particle complex subunit 10 [Tricharina praecox]KAI5852106.1 trafficking protein particle complex subunit 10 [Tricharina praecox]
MEPSSTSKVAVTYWDPAALFPLIAPDLRTRLPLRNLHWKSPARPVRSITSLHVDLLPYSPSPTNLTSPAFQTSAELTRVKSTDSTRSNEGPSNIARSASRSRAGPRKERRHQIPGLRNTPYLKVYILRCDDNESYKNTQRKLLREWVSTHATVDGADNHDAHEWLILHVVLPGTPAAQQPRSSSSASNVTGTSRWMKGSQTLLDKIRSDFNGSNAKIDRVAQIRIAPSHPDLQTLSPPVASTAATTTPETPAEVDTAWLDLVAKLKTQILASFDARVTQYEEDVRERDSQRSLPGWNFCTFFVLKEGLARAFESVGLVEDALVLYDELGFGLEAIVREQEKGEVIGGSFIGWTKEGLYWIEEARKCLKARKTGEGEAVDEIEEGHPIASDKKPYRELILSNEISVFDFRCYLFARQATLLLRLGKRNGDSSQESASEEGDDLTRLAEICRRGVDFITTVARVLRADLTAPHQDSLQGSEKKHKDEITSSEELSAIIDNLIASWTYAVCSQLLQQTTSSAIPEGLEEGSDKGLLPQRSSSLSLKTPAFAQAMKGGITGLEEVVAARAELIVLARTVLEGIGARRGWVGREGWFNVGDGSGEMEEVNLDGDDDATKNEGKPAAWVPEGVRNKDLKAAAEDDGGFYSRFAELSEKAMRYYGLAKRYKSAERVESDLAALKFHLKEYETAAVHLKRMTDFYEEQGWGLIETTLLGMYAKCLKEMQKPEEHTNVLLKLLKKSAAAERARVGRLAGKDVETPPTQSPLGRLNTSHVDVRGYVSEVMALSTDIPREIVNPIMHFWSDVSVDPYPRHSVDQDGFEVGVRMRYLLTDPLTIDKITVRVVSAPPLQGRELTLESSGPIEMRRGIVKSTVSTNQTIPGRYIVEQLTITAGKLKFVHEFMARTMPDTPLGLVSSAGTAIAAAKKTKLSFFPAPRGLTGKLEMPKDIHLEKMRMVEIKVSSGKNTIEKGELRIRSATAGLRLITGSLEVVSGTDVVVVNPEKPGTLCLKEFPAESEIRVRLPYNSDNELTELMVRLEVDYTTEKGGFLFIETLNVLVALPLAVNVQDIFKEKALYSKFQVSTAAAEVPLRVFTVGLHESKTFYAEGGVGTEGSMTVFAKQPANFTYKIMRKMDVTSPPESLALVIEYTNMDEELRETVSSVFERDLKDAGFERYVHWLLPGLFMRFRHRSPTELETAALLEEVDIGTYEEYGWEDALEAIDQRSGERAKVESWLKEFFTKHATIPLNQKDILTSITRSIFIPVEVPALQVMHTVELNLLCDSISRQLSSPYAPPMVTVGVSLQAELIIRHSRHWDTTADAEALAKPMEFFYEVQNNPDTWLISGRKRAHFAGVDGSVETFALVLVPTRPGQLSLPNVEIKCTDGADNVSCETEYKANADVVLVLPDVRSTTVRIDSLFGGEQIAA